MLHRPVDLPWNVRRTIRKNVNHADFLRARWCLAGAFMLLIVSTPVAQNASAQLSPGLGSFVWDDQSGASDPNKPLAVHYFRPAVVDENTPVWMIMHAAGRGAAGARNQFLLPAITQGAVVIAPEFRANDWPGGISYNLGNLAASESDLRPNPETEWSFSKIEPLFDHVVGTVEPDLSASSYNLFGHSAGAQFVHRFLMWKPDARVDTAVVANSGWYTMPQFADPSYDYDWPYSLSNVPDTNALTPDVDTFDPAGLESLLQRNLVVLLGDQDTGRGTSLRKTAAADAQGQHRLHRGQNFFLRGQMEAEARNVPFGWQLKFVRDVGHNGARMAIPAGNIFRLPPPEATLDFSFDQGSLAEPVALDELVSLAGDLQWNADIPGVYADGSGALAVQYDDDGLTHSAIDLGTNRIDPVTNPFARLIVEFEPWQFAGEAGEQVWVGLSDSPGGRVTGVAAQVRLIRRAPDDVRIRAIAAGPNASNSGEVSLCSDLFPDLCNDLQTEPFRVILDLDMASSTYEVRFQSGDRPEYIFFNGSVSFDRIGNFQQLAFAGSFDEEGETFGISRIQLLSESGTVVPEPRSHVILLAGILLGIRRWRRSVKPRMQIRKH